MLSPTGDWSARRLADFLHDDEDVERLISFCTVVLPAHVGGLERGLPDKATSGAVPDVIDRECYHRFQITRAGDGTWTGRDLFASSDDADSWETGDSAEEVCGILTAKVPTGFKRVYLSGSGEENESPVRIAYFAKTGARLDAPGMADVVSLRREDVPLTAHNELAKRFAEQLVKRIALQRNLGDAVIFAAARHDLGKDRQCWQAAIGNTGKPPLAKSARVSFDLGASGGYRHEFGSMLDAAEDPAVQGHQEGDLILHLIAAHHGHGRPGFTQEGCGDERRLMRDCKKAVAEVEERYIALQRRFGWWQLAYLEALVKSADALASTPQEQGQASLQMRRLEP
jgi:CRISPR-associated endonuclease/helicase Cas3